MELTRRSSPPSSSDSLRRPSAPRSVISLSSARLISLMLTKRTSVRGMPSIRSGTTAGRGAGRQRERGSNKHQLIAMERAETCEMCAARPLRGIDGTEGPGQRAPATARQPQLPGCPLTVCGTDARVCEAQQRPHPPRPVHQRASPLLGHRLADALCLCGQQLHVVNDVGNAAVACTQAGRGKGHTRQAGAG